MKRKPVILLGDNHQRGITTALFLLDRMLCEVEEYARGREVRSVFYAEQNTLSLEQKTSLLTEIVQIRNQLQDLKEGLGLAAKTEDVGPKIRGQCSILWEILVETKGRFLNRFGEPPPQLAQYLDPRIDVLIEHLRSLADLARDCGSREQTGHLSDEGESTV